MAIATVIPIDRATVEVTARAFGPKSISARALREEQKLGGDCLFFYDRENKEYLVVKK